MTIEAVPVEINWHPALSIFASEPFLRAVGDEYGWIGGVDDSGAMLCILPYTVVKKAIFRMVRFRVETIPLVGGFTVEQERIFLNSVIGFFRSRGLDMIIPATTNTIFRTYPDGADAAPYGSYVIDLKRPEDVLWKSINRIYRQNISTAIKSGVVIKDGLENLAAAHSLIRETFKRSKLPFMDKASFGRFVAGLGDHGRVMQAQKQGVVESVAVFAFSDYCAYAVYAGNVERQHQGSNKLLYWEAIRQFRALGVRQYDFVGARIDPEKGSKQAALNSFKKRFGANLKQGYMWKYSYNPWKYTLYRLASRLRSSGDIVDTERHKLNSLISPDTVTSAERDDS